jgi:nitrite reductase (NADH) small subunit
MGRPGLAIARTPREIDLGPLELVPIGRVRVVDVGRRRIAVHRTRGGEVFASQASCPHRGESLEGGIIGGRMVLCPGHGYAFNLATGRRVGASSERLRTYVTRVSDEGRILVELDA